MDKYFKKIELRLVCLTFLLFVCQLSVRKTEPSRQVAFQFFVSFVAAAVVEIIASFFARSPTIDLHQLHERTNDESAKVNKQDTKMILKLLKRTAHTTPHHITRINSIQTGMTGDFPFLKQRTLFDRLRPRPPGLGNNNQQARRRASNLGILQQLLSPLLLLLLQLNIRSQTIKIPSFFCFISLFYFIQFLSFLYFSLFDDDFGRTQNHTFMNI